MRRLALFLSALLLVALVSCGHARRAVLHVTAPDKACVSADCGPWSATLNWFVPTVQNQTGYWLFLNGAQVGSSSASPFMFTGFDCATTDTLGVEAHDGAGGHGPLWVTTYTSPSCGSGGTVPTNTTPPYFIQSTGGAVCTGGCAVQGQSLSVTTGTWTCSGGCGTLSYTYQWQDCTTTAGRPPTTGTCSAIAGATSSSYTVATGDVGHAISVAVTAVNSGTTGTATTTAGTSCNRAALPTPGTGSFTSGTSGGGSENNPAGCSPISAVAAATQAGEKFCTNAPITCGYPDPLVPGNVGPTGTLTTVSATCGCLPTGATWSTGQLTISGANVTVQNVLVPGDITINATGFHLTNSKVQGVVTEPSVAGASFSHDWFSSGGDAGYNDDANTGTANTVTASFFNNTCEDVLGFNITVSDSYFLSNLFFNGCHYETTYTPGGTSSAGVPATDYEHDVAVNNFPDNADLFCDNHAFSATGCFNLTYNHMLIVNDGFYSIEGSTTGDTSKNLVVTNNRWSQAYQTGGGSLGTDAFNISATTFTNNLYDDTLGTVPENGG